VPPRLLRVAVSFFGIGFLGIGVRIAISIAIPPPAIKPKRIGEHHYYRDKKAKNNIYNYHRFASPKACNRPAACADYEANVLPHSIAGSRQRPVSLIEEQKVGLFYEF
jgi:hypothetical protein